jgi:hypothetical protein
VSARNEQEHHYNRYQRLKAEGLCVRCQEPRDCTSTCLCAVCLTDARMRERERRGGLKWQPGSAGVRPLEERHERKAG